MKEPNSNSEIENWKKGMFSEDWETVLNSGANLVKIGGREISNFLFDLLDSENPIIRHGAALALHDLKNNEAIEPLLKAIFNPENKNYTGTLVFALENLDCKDRLVDIFKILFFHKYESKMGAYSILNEQIFEFDRDDLLEVQRMWENCCQNREIGEGFNNEETRLMMQDAYEGFIEYLKENY